MDFKYIISQKARDVNSHLIARYVKFVTHSRVRDSSTVLEKHHILPKAKDMFPEYSSCEWNIISLTPREHYIAHFMLSKIFGGSQLFAFMAMNNKNKYKPTHKSASLFYQSNKEEWKTELAKINTVNYWYNLDTNDEIRLRKDENAPAGYIRGKLLSKTQIFNTLTGELSSISHPRGERPKIEHPWSIGSPLHKELMTGTRVIFNTQTGETKRLLKNEELPNGWEYGSPNTKSIKGNVAIHNTKTNEVKYVSPECKLPEGWAYGTNNKNNKGIKVLKDSTGKIYRVSGDDPIIKELGLVGIAHSNEPIRCDVCGKLGMPAGMKRHHFKNCRSLGEPGLQLFLGA